jgi:ribosomal protein L11 methyltransferase
MNGPHAGWRVELIVPGAMRGPFAEMLEDLCEAVSEFEIDDGRDWRIEGFSRARPDIDEIDTRTRILASALDLPMPTVTHERIADIDWLRASYESFPPLTLARFYVHGSHIATPIPAGKVGLLIDAATAFGSGEHASTEGCLRMLDRLARRRARPRMSLDMGCGSGILALAAAKLWHRPVHAVDIDAESVRVSKLNAKLNQVATLVRAATGPGYDTRLVFCRHYDLILANILARPLCRMAKRLAAQLNPGGHAILAGLLVTQAPMVVSAHRSQGLHLVARWRRGDWCTLLLRKRG